jgi:hypothetical protein
MLRDYFSFLVLWVILDYYKYCKYLRIFLVEKYVATLKEHTSRASQKKNKGEYAFSSRPDAADLLGATFRPGREMSFWWSFVLGWGGIASLVCVQTSSKRMNSDLGIVGRNGMFQQQRVWSVWMLLQVIVSGLYMASWGRRFGVGVVSFSVWLLCSSQFGGSVPTLMVEVEIGLMSRLWPLCGMKLEWQVGFVVVEVRWFESTMILSTIGCSDRAIVWMLLVIDGLLVWIDVEEGFEAGKGGLGDICWRVCWYL